MYIACTYKGIEDVTKLEIKEILRVNSKKVFDGRIAFNTKDIKKFIKKVRSVNTVYFLLKNFKFKDEEEILNKVGKLDFSFIKEDFVVRCSRIGKHKFNSMDIERSIGEIIFKKGFKVNLKSETIVYVDVIDDNFFIGYLIKDRLCKRDYRVNISNDGINACLGYSLLRIGGYKKEDVLVDPFCRDGVILIEAGLMKGKKLFGFDNSNNIRNSKINAKMAKVNVEFSSFNVEWLDTRFKERSVDYIITALPYISKRNSYEVVKNELKNLFYTAKYVLKKKMLLLCVKDDFIYGYVKEFNFKIVEKRGISVGNLHYILFVISGNA